MLTKSSGGAAPPFSLTRVCFMALCKFWSEFVPDIQWLPLHSTPDGGSCNIVFDLAGIDKQSGIWVGVLFPCLSTVRVKGLLAVGSATRSLTVFGAICRQGGLVLLVEMPQSAVIMQPSTFETGDFTKMVELCNGVGIASWGFKACGVNIQLAAETQESLGEEYLEQHPATTVICGDINSDDTISEICALADQPDVMLKLDDLWPCKRERWWVVLLFSLWCTRCWIAGAWERNIQNLTCHQDSSFQGMSTWLFLDLPSWEPHRCLCFVLPLALIRFVSEMLLNVFSGSLSRLSCFACCWLDFLVCCSGHTRCSVHKSMLSFSAFSSGRPSKVDAVTSQFCWPRALSRWLLLLLLILLIRAREAIHPGPANWSIGTCNPASAPDSIVQSCGGGFAEQCCEWWKEVLAPTDGLTGWILLSSLHIDFGLLKKTRHWLDSVTLSGCLPVSFSFCRRSQWFRLLVQQWLQSLEIVAIRLLPHV